MLFIVKYLFIAHKIDRPDDGLSSKPELVATLCC
jgi:hypothetical protein